jgi:hypothetical protein
MSCLINGSAFAIYPVIIYMYENAEPEFVEECCQMAYARPYGYRLVDG